MREEIINEGRMREEIIKKGRMREERMREQFNDIAKDADPRVVLQVCDVLVRDYKRRKLGFYLERSTRFDLDTIDGGEKGEEVEDLCSKVCSWVNGFFGFESEGRIAVLGEMVKVGQ